MNQPRRYGMLEPSRGYVVVREFADFDGIVHPLGESWRFLTHSFLPYDDGLSLFVSFNDGSERQIRLQNRPEEQGAIVSSLETYLAPVPGEDAQLTTRPSKLGMGRPAFTAGIGASAAVLAILQQFLIEGSTRRPEPIVAAAALAAAFAAYTAWPIRRERLVRRSIESAIFAKDVRLLLGEPGQALDVFPGPIASRWIYPPATLVGGTPIGIRLAIDFDFSDRVTSVQRV